ncbi:CLUMA_CG012713, isoform A [Clunio marinus]|uniref:CLUMA_CG012713, isoform A n=1 Tax=Clunio marinus TaxID=568069 RepID=A0A1J1IG87_9DIPT|nr:CLUMA_CG012713, isoform A [Clunio marinus]
MEYQNIQSYARRMLVINFGFSTEEKVLRLRGRNKFFQEVRYRKMILNEKRNEKLISLKNYNALEHLQMTMIVTKNGPGKF